MKQKDSSMLWIPLWVDKWIFGSTRIELQPDERSVWVDLMALAAKDCGYIRANPETPYLQRQLAGLLNIEEELLTRTIKRCLEVEKLEETEIEGIFYLKNWNEFQLSDSYIRTIKHRAKIGSYPRRKPKKDKNGKFIETQNVSCETQNAPYRREEHRREEQNIKEKNIDIYMSMFNDFWGVYPKKRGKGKARDVFLKLKPNEELFNRMIEAINIAKKAIDWNKDGGQYIPLPSTWLNQERWDDEYAPTSKDIPKNLQGIYDLAKRWKEEGKLEPDNIEQKNVFESNDIIDVSNQ